MRDWLDVFQVASADGAVIVESMEAVAEYRLSFWNSMLWATARRAGCSAIPTEDMQDGRRLGGVEMINPFTTDAEARLVALLEA